MNEPIKPNILKRTRCYLIGHMQYVNGEGWRTKLKTDLSDRNITFFDPYHKPFVNDIPEDVGSREEMLKWMKTHQYDLVAERMWAVRAYDLRLVDISDFFVANIVPDKASWGSAEEIVTAIRGKKPVFLSIDHPDGKAACPLWIMGMIPHKYIYNNVDEIVTTLKAIDDGIIKTNSDRWRLLKEDLR